MFTGIVEQTARVQALENVGTNLEIWLEAEVAPELKIDQSVAHNGVCLTVVELQPETKRYRVTAVEETLNRSNLGELKTGERINLERSLRVGDRLDGHFVQGHVDDKTELLSAEARDGSWWLTFALPQSGRKLIIPKGSICINGVSLTVAELNARQFAVTIIPYTWEHTNLSSLQPGVFVNLEYDMLGKYMLRHMEQIPTRQYSGH